MWHSQILGSFEEKKYDLTIENFSHLPWVCRPCSAGGYAGNIQGSKGSVTHTEESGQEKLEKQTMKSSGPKTQILCFLIKYGLIYGGLRRHSEAPEDQTMSFPHPVDVLRSVENFYF